MATVMDHVICCKRIPNHGQNASIGTLELSENPSSYSSINQDNIHEGSLKDSLQFSRISLKNNPETQETRRATQVILTDDCFVSLEKDMNQIWDAVDNNQLQLISEFISTNDVSLLEDFDGFTLLHRSVIAGNKEMTETLLNKIDSSAKDHLGRTPLHYACIKSDPEIVDLLLKNSSDPFITDKFGKIPADYCRRSLEIRKIFANFTKIVRSASSTSMADNSISSIQGLKRKIKSQNIESEISRKSEPSEIRRVSIGHQKVRRLTGPIDKSSFTSYLDDYEVVNVLGVSYIGVIYLVRESKSSTYYALKVVEKQKLKKDCDKQMVLIEKKLMILLNHPFINPLVLSLQTKHKLLMISPFCSGGSLALQLLEKGRLPLDDIRLYACELVEVLEYLHEKSIVYRGLSLKNILLTSEGHIHLSNFQLAIEGLSEDVSALSYHRQLSLPPEMLNGELHGKAVDWYMLGLVLYELATGLQYFPGECNEPKQALSLITDPHLLDLLSGLLQPTHFKRLGFESSESVKCHHFFNNINWFQVSFGHLAMPTPVGLDTFPQFTDLELSINEEYTSDKPFPNWTFIND
jgi:hypothetical protein